jgi:hypothetical protein
LQRVNIPEREGEGVVRILISVKETVGPTSKGTHAIFIEEIDYV